MISAWFGSLVAQNWVFFIIGWVAFGLLFAFPSLFTWAWAIIGWNVTATRAASSSAKAAIREVLAEEAAKKGATS